MKNESQTDQGTVDGKKMLKGFAYTQIPLMIASIYISFVIGSYNEPLLFVHVLVVQFCLSIAFGHLVISRHPKAQ